MIGLQIDVANEASAALLRIISMLEADGMRELNQVAGRAVVNAAIQYHREFDKAGGWKGSRYLGSTQNSGAFGASVARGWNVFAYDQNGLTVSNEADYYSFKVSGGTVTPKRAKYLTIPLIREARGMYVSVYEQNTGNKLFKPKGKNVLMERTGKGTARAVYALRTSVTHDPWPNALPPREMMADAYMTQLAQSIEELLAEQ